MKWIDKMLLKLYHMKNYKKLFISAAAIITLNVWAFVFATWYSVNISAVVWNLNHAPKIVSVNPASDPRLIWINKIQKYSLYMTDDELDTIYYTITPKDWYSNPISWIINSFDSGSWAYINFTYLSPSTSVNSTKITITLNDWPNLVSKDINLYVY